MTSRLVMSISCVRMQSCCATHHYVYCDVVDIASAADGVDNERASWCSFFYSSFNFCRSCINMHVTCDTTCIWSGTTIVRACQRRSKARSNGQRQDAERRIHERRCAMMKMTEGRRTKRDDRYNHHHPHHHPRFLARYKRASRSAATKSIRQSDFRRQCLQLSLMITIGLECSTDWSCLDGRLCTLCE